MEKQTEGAAEAEQWRIAYHEAGHAIVARMQSLPVHCVTIIPREEDGTLGHFTYSHVCWVERDEFEPASIALLAGLAAETRFFFKRGRDVDWGGVTGACGDMSAVLDAIKINVLHPDEVLPYFDWLGERAKTWVEDCADAIEMLAGELIERRELTGEDVTRVVTAFIYSNKEAAE
jgi:ATP-dependent Zn protease